jgi:hypothetical protein
MGCIFFCCRKDEKIKDQKLFLNISITKVGINMAELDEKSTWIPAVHLGL